MIKTLLIMLICTATLHVANAFRSIQSNQCSIFRISTVDRSLVGAKALSCLDRNIHFHASAQPNLHSEQVSDKKPWSLVAQIKQKFPAKIITSLTFLTAICFMFVKKAHAAKAATLRGWDIYGRVPYDDFLFTNEILLDPNFLRKSMVEAVAVELPIAFKAFRRTRVVGEITSVITRATIGLLSMTAIALCFLYFRGRYSRFQQREIDLMGYTSPTSARYKNRNYGGRSIDSVDGFVDMSRGLNFEEQERREVEDAERRQRKLEEDERLRNKRNNSKNKKKKDDEDDDSDDEED